MRKKLKINQLFLIFILQFYLFSIVLANDNNELVRFERELFTPQALSHFGMSVDRFKSLTSVQKRDLLETRKILTSFLKSIQNPDVDLSQFLRQEFLARYKTRNELLSKLLDPETEIFVTAVTDFELQQNNTLNLKHYVILFSEGNLLIREDLVRFKKYESSWKIVNIGGL